MIPEREHKVAITVYPFFDNNVHYESVIDYLKMNEKQTRKNEAIIYIHIPFCDSICDFCIYNRIKADYHIMEEYTHALISEISLFAKTEYAQSTQISAVYFGGGTPSSLSELQINRVIDACWSKLNISKDTEFTFEVNTVNATKDKLFSLKSMGINRISAGIQTFNDNHRANLGVRQNSKEVMRWIEIAAGYCFDTIAIDLMYGLPTQTACEWQEDLEIAVSLPVGHISIYELHTFPNTRLGQRVIGGNLTPCLNAEKYLMFLSASDGLERNSFCRQIVPEYSKKNHFSLYWDLAFNAFVDTIAFGVSSFGFINRHSYQNITSINEYLKSVQQETLPIKQLSSSANNIEMAERDMIFSLRKGYVDKEDFYKRNGYMVSDFFGTVLDIHAHDGILTETDKGYYLSNEGLYTQEDVAIKYMRSTFDHKSKSQKRLILGTYQLNHTI